MIICSSTCRSNGYDYQFVEEASDDLKCLICLCVARDPQQHGDGGCGKIYCKSCIDKYKTKNRDFPNCQRDMGTKIFTPAQLINVCSTSVQVKDN